MPPDPTTKQKRLLDYLQNAIERHGQIPSLRHAAAELGVSHAAVAQMLKALEEKGLLRRGGRYSRTLYLLNRARQTAATQRWREIPVIGRVTAGVPMYAQPEWEEAVVLDGTIFKGQHLFALRVRGDSMVAAGILNNDLAICEPREYARNGEIVVALVRNEEATIKRFFRHADHVELRPENPRYAPLRYPFDEVLVQGRVVGIQRGPDGIR
jgi:repressor LexA